MGTLLLQDVEYAIEKTAHGTWRRYLYEGGARFSEYKSHARVMGFPLVHITIGRCPETGRRIVAKGVIAIGRVAIGVLAIGQASAGIVAIGQVSLGVLLGIGQATLGIAAIGQAALGVGVAVGQFVCGHVAVAQFAFGEYVLAQFGEGTHVWDMRGADPVAVDFFKSLW